MNYKYAIHLFISCSQSIKNNSNPKDEAIVPSNYHLNGYLAIYAGHTELSY